MDMAARRASRKAAWRLIPFVMLCYLVAILDRVARSAHKGLWAGAFIAPWDWRWRTVNAVILAATRPTQDQERVVRPTIDSSWWRGRRP
jgi:hypothetical protein